MAVLTTGANSQLARAFLGALSTSARLYAVDTHFDEPIPGVIQITGDLRDPTLLADVLAEITAVVHLAPLCTQLNTDQETLSHTVQGTYQLATAAAERGGIRFVMAGAQTIFGTLWRRYRVDETWQPRPTPQVAQLGPYLAEIALREVARVTGLNAFSLRCGAIVDAQTAATAPFDPHWLHIDDAVAALQQAMVADETAWRIYHIGAKGERAAMSSRIAIEELDYHPQHDFRERWPSEASPAQAQTIHPAPARPIRRVVLFGAGGPLGSVVAAELGDDYELHLTDVHPIETLRSAEPQSPGAPLPVLPSPPHEWRVVDVCDAAQVMEACAGADAVINCSVARYGEDASFGVNMVGAYNVMQAAVAHGIFRVVHTGPFMLGDRSAYGYDWDFGIVDDVPPRPGIDWVYIPSKLAGQEICRIFAERHGLSVPALGFCQFVSPEGGQAKSLYPLAVSWEDAARAVRAALEVQTLPHPYEYFHVGVDLPHGKFTTEKARNLLKWQPQDSLEEFYVRPDLRGEA